MIEKVEERPVDSRPFSQAHRSSRRTLLNGGGYTLLLTVACTATGLLVGLDIAIARELGGAWLSGLLSTFVFVLRGVPMLVLLFLVFFGLPGTGLDVPPLLAMMLSLGLISGAYLSEVFRGALATVNPNEVLAAQSMGFTRFQTLRLIKLPQMKRFAVPCMVNELTTVIKFSPFAYTVGVPEITKQAMALVSNTMREMEIYGRPGCSLSGHGIPSSPRPSPRRSGGGRRHRDGPTVGGTHERREFRSGVGFYVIRIGPVSLARPAAGLS